MTKKRVTEEHVLSSGQDGAIGLLRICTILLAAVSFWATAQGMSNYVFTKGWQAYVASLGVQGILLGLNFYLPAFWKMIKGSLPKLGLAFLAILLLICSSWFSFVFIVEKVYGDSWGIESRLLIQSTYRRQLYNANDYAENYKDMLAESLDQQIISLYNRAKELEAKEIDSAEDINWEEEKNIYVVDGFAARNEMSAIIDAMEIATDSEAAQSQQEQAAEIILEMKSGLEDTSGMLLEEIEKKYSDISKANENLNNANQTLSRMRGDVDSSNLIEVINTLQQNLKNLEDQKKDLEERRADYQTALIRVRLYEANLGLVSKGTSNLVSASLRSIQQELFQAPPSLDELEMQAVAIFQQLQTAQNVSDNEGEKYQELLKDIDQFIDDLRDYRNICVATDDFDDMTEELRSDTSILIDEEMWKEQWTERLDTLKTRIAVLPVYTRTEAEDKVDISGKTVSGSEHAGEKTVQMLEYDRADASDELDKMIRLYIADHNAVQQGLIYLYCPYRGLAVFSVILAFALDIIAFVAGLIIEARESTRKSEMDTDNESNENNRDVIENEDIEDDENKKMKKKSKMLYNLLVYEKELERYIYLNGDYVCLEGKNTYRAIEKGEEIEIDLSKPGLTAGIYIERDKEFRPVTKCQDIQFMENPQDGVYHKCYLKYEDYALEIKKEKKDDYYFLANITDNIPVYKLEKNKVEIITIESLKEKKVTTAILALNKKGTRIIAIYLCDIELTDMTDVINEIE